MQAEPNSKQQIVERIKTSTNILVTVGRNPSVDALSAALSLTLMLNRLEKHATAVFSGEVPQAISFLEPAKTFENTVDSLRDFIIALDKEKADRLRYKVENDVVRIFITPYRTVISEKDLKFSQGDFNVELIIALGVEKREDLDTAITAHGRILHDATVVTINADSAQPSLGALDWTDPGASSLCEMLMSISEALQPGLLDQQIATAVLTGIVAATDRFRNEHTSPRVMTMAAQLMAAGANQQLIAAKLEEGHELPAETKANDGALEEGKSKKLPREEKKNEGELTVEHVEEADAKPVQDPADDALKEAEAELAESLQTTAPAAATITANDLQKDLEDATKEAESVPAPEEALAKEEQNEPQAKYEATKPEASKSEQNKPKVVKQKRRSWQTKPTDKPSFGGTLNATVSEAEAAKVASVADRSILSHDTVGSTVEPTQASLPASPVVEQTAPAAEESAPVVPELDLPVVPPVAQPSPEPQPEQVVVPEPAPQPAPLPVAEAVLTPELPVFEEVAEKPLETSSDPVLSFEPAPINAPATSAPSLADIDESARGKAAEDARAAIDAALGALPFDPASQPLASAGATPVFENIASSDVPLPPAPITPEPFMTPNDNVINPADQPSFPPMAPALPPLPDFSTLPELPPTPQEASAPTVSPEPNVVPDDPIPSAPDLVAPPEIPQSETPSDPAQFKIPGQP